MFSSRRPVIKSDTDSDVESRYRSSFSKEGSKSYHPSSSRNSISRDVRDSRELRPIRDGRDKDNDRYDSNSRYSSYRSNNNRFQSDSDDDKSNNRYGASSRRTARRSSDSEDSDDKNDRLHRSNNSKSSRQVGLKLPSTRRKTEDFDSYENAHQKLKEMIHYDKSLCEQLDDLYDSKLAKEKKIEQLKDDIHRDSLKEENLRKKLSELRINKKILQSKLDEYK